MLGIVPQSTTLAVPVDENSYEYTLNMPDPSLFNINLAAYSVTVSLVTAGTLNFHFNQTVTGTFSSPGVYTVQFSPDWNRILSINLASALPSNRQYMYNTMQTSLPLHTQYVLQPIQIQKSPLQAT